MFNRLGSEFVKDQLALIWKLIRAAQSHLEGGRVESCARALENAKATHGSVEQHLPVLRLSEDQMRALVDELASLRGALARVEDSKPQG